MADLPFAVSKDFIMGVKVTIHWLKPNTDITHTLAVDETELDSYLDMGYVLGPAPGDVEISPESTRKFIEKYVPPGLRYEDISTQNQETLVNKSVALFEDILAGHAGPEYLHSIDDLYEYWDVIGKNYHDKVRTLLDPQEISTLVLQQENNSQMGVFLYHLANIFATKGTKRSIVWVLKLLDVQVDFIRWYEPEFLMLRPAIEQCRTIIKIYVGQNTAINAEVVALVNRLVDFLIDICTVIVGWVYVKSFTDTVEIEENNEPLLTLNTSLYDCYSHCILEIYNQEKQGVYGVHARGNLDSYWYIFGSSWDPIYFLKGCLLHGQGIGDCGDILHTGLLKHCGLMPEMSCTPEAGLIHVNDTTVRHCGPDDEDEDLVYHDEGLFHNELRLIKYDYIECLNFRKEFPRSAWGIHQWPTHMGSKDTTDYWTRGSANFTFCNPDPSVQDMTFTLTEQASYTELHNFTSFVHGSSDDRAIHSNPQAFNLCAFSTVGFDVRLEETVSLDTSSSTTVVKDRLVDGVPVVLRHDGAHSHDYPVPIITNLKHSFDPEILSYDFGYTFEDEVQIVSSRGATFGGGSYHDGVDRETRPLIKSGDKYYLKLPQLFNDKDVYTFSNKLAFIHEKGSDSVSGGFPDSDTEEYNEDINGGGPWTEFTVVTKSAYEFSSGLSFGLSQQVPNRIYHDSVYLHGDGNDHHGYDEINFTGTYDWRLTHKEGSSNRIKSSVIENDIVTNLSYGPGEDPILWSLDSFDALLREHHSDVELPTAIGSSYNPCNTLLVSSGPWLLEGNVWNDDGIWIDSKQF